MAVIGGDVFIKYGKRENWGWRVLLNEISRAINKWT